MSTDLEVALGAYRQRFEGACPFKLFALCTRADFDLAVQLLREAVATGRPITDRELYRALGKRVPPRDAVL